MSGWVLVPCLVTLRGEFDALSPGRDKTSDGSVGDLAHVAEGNSDHDPDEQFPALRGKDADDLNEVHAIDVDNDLRKPGWTMDKCLEIIITRHRTGLDDRLQNVIYNRRIWSRSWGWTARAYTGTSPHTEHAHFSSRYGSGPGPGNPENDTRPWGIAPPSDLNGDDDVDWNDTFDSPSWAGRAGTNKPTYGDAIVLAAIWSKDAVTAVNAALAKLLDAYTSQGHVDEQTLGASIAAALGPQIIAALPSEAATLADVEQALREVLRTGVGTA